MRDNEWQQLPRIGCRLIASPPRYSVSPHNVFKPKQITAEQCDIPTKYVVAASCLGSPELTIT
jgi:hypothetical protein